MNATFDWGLKWKIRGGETVFSGLGPPLGEPGGRALLNIKVGPCPRNCKTGANCKFPSVYKQLLCCLIWNLRWGRVPPKASIIHRHHNHHDTQTTKHPIRKHGTVQLEYTRSDHTAKDNEELWTLPLANKSRSEARVSRAQCAAWLLTHQQNSSRQKHRSGGQKLNYMHATNHSTRLISRHPPRQRLDEASLK